MAVSFSSRWPEKGREYLKSSNDIVVNYTGRASNGYKTQRQLTPKMPEEMDIYLADIDYCTQAHYHSQNAKMRHLYRTMKKVYTFFGTNIGIYGVNGRGGLPLFFLGLQEESCVWLFTGDEENQCYWSFDDKDKPSPEAMAHEYMHSIINRRNPIPYEGMCAELIEAMCDIGAITCKHWLAYRSHQRTNWKIEGLRDLAAHVDMRDLQSNHEINEHVHDNSRILSHAFYKAVQDLKEVSFGTIAKIWWQAFLDAGCQETYSSFASRTIMQARVYDSKVQDAIERSWLDVGLLKSCSLSNIQLDGTLNGRGRKVDKGRLRVSEISNFPYQPPFIPRLWDKVPYNEFP